MIPGLFEVPRTQISNTLPNGYEVKLVGGYRLIKVLGVGAFGSVHLGIKNDKKFAVKIYNLESRAFQSHFDYLLKHVELEIKMLREMEHPNILSIRDSFKTSNIYLVTDFFEDGDMLNFIRCNGFLSEAQVMKFMPQVVSALKYAADRSIVHRDIKLENLLMDKDKVIVADFGLAKYMEESSMGTIIGTASMKAPEIQNPQGCGYGFAVDVWSLGVSFYMAVFQTDPWEISRYLCERNGEYKLKSLMSNNRISATNSGKNLRFPNQPKISDSLKKLFRRMITFEAKDRITLLELCVELNLPTQSTAPVAISNYINDTYQIVAQGSNDINESIIENRVTFDPVDKMIESSQIINQFTFPKPNCKSNMLDLYLTGNGHFGAGDGMAISHPKLLNRRQQEVEEKYVEQYIIHNITLCHFFFDRCQRIQIALEFNQLCQMLRGVFSLTSNLLAKKVVQIANYFRQKLGQDAPFFTEICKKFEFYQNNFAKQYLERFDEILDYAIGLNSLTEYEVRSHLPQSYYRRDFQLEISSNNNKFSKAELEALDLSIFYLFNTIHKYGSNYNKREVDEAKLLVISLKAIASYRDRVIFKADEDYFNELHQTLGSLSDPHKLEAQYQQDRDYFRKWKDSLKN